MRKWLIVIAIAIGWGITWLDSSPTWEGTEFTALLIVLSSGVLGFLLPKRPWLVALAVGIWIPLVGVFIRHNFGGILALVVAFIGAYSGMFMRRISKTRPSTDE